MNKEIIILAKSVKHGEYCIAGIDTYTGKWVRPISLNTAKEGSVSPNDITYINGSQVQIFDKVQIKFLSHKPTKSQPENYIYDSSVKWIKNGESSLDEVLSIRGYDLVDLIFYNYDKEVDEDGINGQPSLILVNVKKPHIFLKTFSDGNKRVQLNFEFNNHEYNYFKVSDEIILKKYETKQDGSYNIGENLSVVFSLTDRFDKTGKYYKMVATAFC